MKLLLVTIFWLIVVAIVMAVRFVMDPNAFQYWAGWWDGLCDNRNWSHVIFRYEQGAVDGRNVRECGVILAMIIAAFFVIAFFLFTLWWATR